MNRQLALAAIISVAALSQTSFAKGPAIQAQEYFMTQSGNIAQVGAPVRVMDGEQIYSGSDGRQHAASEILRGTQQVQVSASTDFLVQVPPKSRRDQPLKIEIQKIHAVVKDLNGKVIGYKIAGYKSDEIVQARELPKSANTVAANEINNFIRNPAPGLVDFSWHTLNTMLADKNPESQKALAELIKSAQTRPNYASTKLGKFYALMLAEKTKGLPEFKEVFELVKEAKWNQKLSTIEARTGAQSKAIVLEAVEAAEASR